MKTSIVVVAFFLFPGCIRLVDAQPPPEPVRIADGGIILPQAPNKPVQVVPDAGQFFVPSTPDAGTASGPMPTPLPGMAPRPGAAPQAPPVPPAPPGSAAPPGGVAPPVNAS